MRIVAFMYYPENPSKKRCPYILITTPVSNQNFKVLQGGWNHTTQAIYGNFYAFPEEYLLLCKIEIASLEDFYEQYPHLFI